MNKQSAITARPPGLVVDARRVSPTQFLAFCGHEELEVITFMRCYPDMEAAEQVPA